MVGIYQIQNLINGKLYIGSSVNVNERICEHKRNLCNGHHENEHLQKSCDKYGIENFIFDIVETIRDKYNLLRAEQEWIDYYNKHGVELYNINPIAGSQLGFRHSDKTKKLYSITRRGNGNPMYGKEHSKETRKKIGLKSIGRKTKGFLGHKHTEVSKLKISETILRNKGKTVNEKIINYFEPSVALWCYNVPTHKRRILDYKGHRNGEGEKIYPFIERDYNGILE